MKNLILSILTATAAILTAIFLLFVYGAQDVGLIASTMTIFIILAVSTIYDALKGLLEK